MLPFCADFPKKKNCSLTYMKVVSRRGFTGSL